MQQLRGMVRGDLTAGSIGFLSFGHSAFAEQVSGEQVLEHRGGYGPAQGHKDSLRLTQSMTFNDRDYEVASVRSKPATDLEINFDFNSAAITRKAEAQLDELDAPLDNPLAKGATISINGSWPCLQQEIVRAPSHLRTVGYGKTRLTNPWDLNAPGIQRVKAVHLAAQTHGNRNIPSSNKCAANQMDVDQFTFG
jgi:hypothetical protein